MNKHTLLKPFLVTLVLMLLAACQNDELGLEPEDDVKLNTLSFKIKDISSNQIPESVHAVVNNKTTFYNNSPASNKSTGVENITVQNDSARVIELDNGKVSYTFKVESSDSYNQQYFENIVVVYPDSTKVNPTTYLVKYTLSEDQWSNYYSTGILDFDPENVTSTLLSESEHDQIFNKNSTPCDIGIEMVVLSLECTLYYMFSNGCNREDSFVICGNGGGGGGVGSGSSIPGGWLPDPDAPIPGGGTDNNGGGGGGTADGDNDLPLDGALLTSPYVGDVEDSEFIQNLNQIKDCLGPNLNPQDGSWLAQQSDEFVQEIAGLMDDCNPASSPYESIWEAVDEIILDPSFENNECLLSVWHFAGGSKKLNGYLESFNNSSIANLRFSASNEASDSELSNGVNAYTAPPLSNNTINIVFNLDNLERPNLDVFRTLVHETIHATMFRWMLIAAETENLNFPEFSSNEYNSYVNSLRNNFPGIYLYYYLNNFQDPDHEQMAAHFIPIIANSLAEFDENSQTSDFYESIAWIGLKEYEVEEGVWQATISWDTLTEERKNQLNETYDDFHLNLEEFPSCSD